MGTIKGGLSFVLVAVVLALALASALRQHLVHSVLFQPQPPPPSSLGLLRLDNGKGEGGSGYYQQHYPVAAEFGTLSTPPLVVFYLHGNAENAADSLRVMQDFHRRFIATKDSDRPRTITYVCPEYPGYSEHDYGKVSMRIGMAKEAVLAVARAVLDQHPGAEVVVVGRSLGSGLAAYLATELKPKLLVLISPFTSLPALARDLVGFWGYWIMPDLLPTDYHLRQLKESQTEVVLIHGKHDRLIPAAHSQDLARLVPVRLHLVPGSHNQVDWFPHLASSLLG